jgi:ankyrin repeat protein
MKARHHVGRERHACGIGDCNFKASRKDNLQQHRSNVHGIRPYSGRRKEREKPLRMDTIKGSHISDATLSRSASLDCPVDEEAWTCAAFLQAATVGNLFIIEAALNLGMDINVVGDDKSSALHCAARAGQSSAIRYLLEQGADRDAKNKMQRSPLQEALLSRDLETVELLLHSGANLSNSYVTLDCLGQCGSVEILRICLAHLGTSVTADTVFGILISASKAGHDSLVAGILSLSNKQSHEPATVDERPQDTISETRLNLPHADFSRDRGLKLVHGYKLLRYASAQGRLSTVQTLLNHGFDINKVIRGSVPLHLAARGGRANVVEFLLSQETIEIKQTSDQRGLTPLHLAAMNGKIEVARLLLSSGDSSVCQTDFYDETPLHPAARFGHSELVQLLLQHPHHNDSRCSNRYKQFPLQLAALHGHWNVAKILLEHEEMLKSQGATVALQQKSRTPGEIFKILLEHPDFSDVNLYDLNRRGKKEGLLHAAIRKDVSECIQILLSHEKIDVNLALDNSATPLGLAAKLGRTEAVELLLQHKNIDVNKYFGYYREDTALSIARNKGYRGIVNLLLAHGAKDTDITAPSSDSIPVVAGNATDIHAQIEQAIDLDFEEHSYPGVDEYLDGVFNCVESKWELPTANTAWLDTVMGEDGST